jgi:hypothetical protein
VVSFSFSRRRAQGTDMERCQEAIRDAGEELLRGARPAVAEPRLRHRLGQGDGGGGAASPAPLVDAAGSECDFATSVNPVTPCADPFGLTAAAPTTPLASCFAAAAPEDGDAEAGGAEALGACADGGAGLETDAAADAGLEPAVDGLDCPELPRSASPVLDDFPAPPDCSTPPPGCAPRWRPLAHEVIDDACARAQALQLQGVEVQMYCSFIEVRGPGVGAGLRAAMHCSTSRHAPGEPLRSEATRCSP